jgi:hypothetical protein
MDLDVAARKTGEAPVTYHSEKVAVGASWGPDNSIVFAVAESAGLLRVSADGGKPETLTKPDPKREEWSHRLPSWRRARFFRNPDWITCAAEAPGLFNL